MLDAGLLISIDRGEDSAKTFLNASIRREWTLVTTEPVIAQVWRHGPKQARLAAFLKTITAAPFDDGREVGALLAASRTSDPVDAHIVLVAARLDEPILTGDPADITRLCAALGRRRPTVYEWPMTVA